MTNLIQRDSFCVPLSAYGRALDHALAPDARVFLSGMIRERERPEAGLLLFPQKLSFPARRWRYCWAPMLYFGEGGWFTGHVFRIAG